MASNSEFWELYRHPLWQKKKSTVMSLANFECAECGDNKTTLNVHHTYYKRGAKPWEYEDGELKCLCEPCHKKYHRESLLVKKLIGGFTTMQLQRINGYAKGMAMQDGRSSGLRIKIDSSGEFCGIIDSYRLNDGYTTKDGHYYTDNLLYFSIGDDGCIGDEDVMAVMRFLGI